MLNNNPEVFSAEKRPIVEFAVENAKAVKLLEGRRENIAKKAQLKEQMTDNKENLKAVQKPKKLRPWQIAKEERKKKRRLEQRFAILRLLSSFN